MDREKVIKALECRKNAGKRCGNPCEESGMCHYATAVRDINGEIYRPFICDRERICVDALALLKEQQEQIEALKQTAQSMMEGIVVSQPQIVRCKDCRRYYANGGNCDQVLADWFCADGEKRE